MLKTYRSDLLDYTVTQSLKEPGHYQVTSFDQLGPFSDRQCESWAEVEQCLQEYMARPVKPESMRFIN